MTSTGIWCARLETRIGRVASASGESIAVRRTRISTVPEGVVNGDIWLWCQLAREGVRGIRAGRTIDRAALPAAAELALRSRIGAGRLLRLSEIRRLPIRFTWRVLSHKHARLRLTGHRPPGVAVPVSRVFGRFLLCNYVVAVGVVRSLRGRQGVRWEAMR
jgi:hypothetical protein